MLIVPFWFFKVCLKDRERSSIFWLTAQMSTVTRVGLGWRQEAGTLPWYSTWVAGTQVLETSSTAFPDALAGSWVWREASGSQSNLLIWDVGVPRWRLNLLYHNVGFGQCSFLSLSFPLDLKAQEFKSLDTFPLCLYEEQFWQLNIGIDQSFPYLAWVSEAPKSQVSGSWMEIGILSSMESW